MHLSDSIPMARRNARVADEEERSMLVITIAGCLLAITLVIWALSAFEDFAARRYNHRFFTVGSFFATAAAVGCILGGRYWWQLALQQSGDVLNGIVLMALGSVLVLGMIIRNLRRAGCVVGACGSVLQVSVFGTLGSLGLVALGVGLLLSFVCVLLLSVGATQVYVVNRW
jgi:hypothetical protein